METVQAITIKMETPENEKNNISLVDFPLICRICFMRSNLRLFKEEECLWDLFLILTKIKVQSTVDFPRNVCNECIDKLKDISLFIEISRNTDLYFEKNMFSIKMESGEANDVYDDERSRYCRACLSTSNLSSFEEKATLLQLFQDITKIDVRANVDSWKRNSICYKCTNQLQNASSFSSLSVNNNRILERLAVDYVKKEVLNADVDESFVMSDDLNIGCGDIHNTTDIKKEVLDDGCDRSSESFIEYNNLHTSIDIKEDVFDRELMISNDPSELESCALSQSEEKSYETGLKRIENGIEIDRQKYFHSGEKPYKCEHCGKGFTGKQHLRTHLRTHTGEKPFKCDCCDKGFSHKHTLEYHLLTHTQEKPFKCYYCGKGFAAKGTLRSHLLIHTGEKPYKCDQCDKKFSQRGQLRSHLLTHTGEKPYNCDHCHKEFTRKQNLQTHLRTHTGEKPFKCYHCSKGFTQKKVLEYHLLSHTGEKRFKCDYCDKGFARKGNLQSHLSTHHSHIIHQNFN